jgi:hypothetical protein
VNPIDSAFTGDGLQSKEIRSPQGRKELDLRMQGTVYIIRYRSQRL